VGCAVRETCLVVAVVFVRVPCMGLKIKGVRWRELPRLVRGLCGCACLLTGLSAGAAELAFDFESTDPGAVPAGFRSVLSGNGAPGNWSVMATEVAPRLAPLTSKAQPERRRVLAQLSEDITDERFPMLLYDDQEFGDFEFTTRFMNVRGAFEQMAGLAFRVVDENNYYYVRASSIGSTFRFFKVVKGLRSDAIGVDLEIPRGQWHEMSVRCHGNQIECFLNGKQVIPTITDNSFIAGRVGFWTKSDAVAYFTDAHLSFTPRETTGEVLIREALRQYPRTLEIRIYAARDRAAGQIKVIASSDPSMLKMEGGDVERKVVESGATFYGKSDGGGIVTLPLRDRNGEPIAAARFVIKSFRGQTEANAITRVVPIRQLMEERLRSHRQLFE
jgi:hypothetical protein